jgi:hypothetical protein
MFGPKMTREPKDALVLSGRFSRPASDEPFYSALLTSVERGTGAPRRAEAGPWKGWLDGAQRRGEFRRSERDWLGGLPLFSRPRTQAQINAAKRQQAAGASTSVGRIAARRRDLSNAGYPSGSLTWGKTQRRAESLTKLRTALQDRGIGLRDVQKDIDERLGSHVDDKADVRRLENLCTVRRQKAFGRSGNDMSIH